MGNYVPSGSYSKTCKDIKVTLTCKAEKIDKTWVDASLNITSLSNADIANMDGVLQNQGTRVATGYVPGGSYFKTCKDIKVTLTCKAEKIDKSWADASLDITSLSNADIANRDGVLINQARKGISAVFTEISDGESRNKTMTNSKDVQIISLINPPFLPEIPSTGNINPFVDTKIEEYQKLVENFNREAKIDRDLLEEMKRVYDQIEDGYKKVLAEIIKYSIVKENAVGQLPDMRFKGSTKSILIALGITLGVPMLLQGAALYAQYIIRGLEARHIAIQAAVMAGEGELAANMANIANLEAKLLKMYRLVRVLRAGTWIVLAATLIWSGYEIYSNRNDTIRKLNKVREDLSQGYNDYNKLANYQMEQARMLRNLVLSFHLDKEGKESLIFELNNKKYDFEKIFERSLCKKAEERKQMTEDQRRIATEEKLIKDMNSFINSILTENLNQVKNFNTVCETAFKSFKKGTTIEKFKELAEAISLDIKLTDEQLQIIADASKEATTLDKAKFFEIYVPESITRYYELDQKTQRIAAEE